MHLDLAIPARGSVPAVVESGPHRPLADRVRGISPDRAGQPAGLDVDHDNIRLALLEVRQVRHAAFVRGEPAPRGQRLIEDYRLPFDAQVSARGFPDRVGPGGGGSVDGLKLRLVVRVRPALEIPGAEGIGADPGLARLCGILVRSYLGLEFREFVPQRNFLLRGARCGIVDVLVVQERGVPVARLLGLDGGLAFRLGIDLRRGGPGPRNRERQCRHNHDRAVNGVSLFPS